MSLARKSLPVSWDQFHRDARALAWRLAGVNGQWRAIVCITRGGLVPAAIISRELGVRLIETVCIASYHDYTSQGELAVLKEIAPTLLENDGEGILIIDDLTDTGKTAGDRARDDAEGAFRHRLRQAERPAAGRHLRHRSLAGHLDLLSRGTWASPTRSRLPTTIAARSVQGAVGTSRINPGTALEARRNNGQPWP